MTTSCAGRIWFSHANAARLPHILSHVHGEPVEPNDLMTVGYRGKFLLRNHRYCYPLTVVDHVSRYLLACEAFPSSEGPHTRRAFERIFREYGLPWAILSDNGSPSDLLVWQGFRRYLCGGSGSASGSERIVPGQPEQNGAHERMHRTLKAETARPPEQTMERQQKRLGEFRRVYNDERPHEALGQKRPFGSGAFGVRQRKLPLSDAATPVAARRSWRCAVGKR